MERLTQRGFNYSCDFVASHLQSWPIAQALKKLQQIEDAMEDQEHGKTHFDQPAITPPPNDPLTLEELEGMVGEPLYVIPVEKDPDWKPCWVICAEGYILVNSTTRENRAYILRRNKDYGKTWLAYRHRPEEGTV